MMTRDEVNRKLCAIISTLAEFDFSPESVLYLGIGASLDDWDMLRAFMVNAGLMTCKHNECRLTDAGRTMAANINAATGAK